MRMFGFALTAGACAALGFACGRYDADAASRTAVSPDGETVVTLRERRAGMDRQFDVNVARRGAPVATIWRSGDEGPIGSEVVLWSKDSQSFMIIGRNFSVEDRFRCVPPFDAYSVYLVVSLHTDEVWSNSAQRNPAPLTEAALRKSNLSEYVALPAGK